MADHNDRPPSARAETGQTDVPPPNGPSDSSPDAPSPDASEQRRQQLKAIDRRLAEDRAASGTVDEGDELNKLLAGLLTKKTRRKHQLKVIKDFFDDPTKFGVDADELPHSSSREEILARHKELTYRVRLLGSVLKLLRRELAELTGESPPGA